MDDKSSMNDNQVSSKYLQNDDTDIPDELPSDPQADQSVDIDNMPELISRTISESDLPDLNKLMKADSMSRSTDSNANESKNEKFNQKNTLKKLNEQSNLGEAKLDTNFSTISKTSNESLEKKSATLELKHNPQVVKNPTRSSKAGNLSPGDQKSKSLKSSASADEVTKKLNYKQVTGKPVKIIDFDPESRKIIFYENELRNVFEKNNALNKLICVCSVAGDFRKGKSFLLNYCLRFLKNNNDYLNRLTEEINADWLGNINEPLRGFSWRSGCDLETTGIYIWSELYTCKYFEHFQSNNYYYHYNIGKVPKNNFDIMKTSSSNLDSISNPLQPQDLERHIKEDEECEDAVICILDSQGAFDEKSSISDCATIFSLVFLISSMQIYNVLHQLQEDNLQYLQLFSEYGKLIYEEGIHCKPFQRLSFLIRDWFSPSEFKYGYEGGQEYLQKKFKTKKVDKHKKLNTENLQSRQHILKYFDKIDAFLLPNPGRIISSSSDYSGNWGDMQYEFLIKLKEFVEWWFNDLQLKRTTDYLPQKMTGSDFISFFKLLSTKISERTDDTIKPTTLFDSMAKISHANAIEECTKEYQHKLNVLFGRTKPFYWPQSVEKISKQLEDRFREKYLKKKKFGNKQYEKEYLTKLNQQFKDVCNFYLDLNEFKCTILPAYLLITFLIILTHMFSIAFQLLFSIWIFNCLLFWVIRIEFLLLNLSIMVELFGFQWGSMLVSLMRKHLQFFYHLACASKIDESNLNI